jgi:hypothetical protein
MYLLKRMKNSYFLFFLIVVLMDSGFAGSIPSKKEREPVAQGAVSGRNAFRGSGINFIPNKGQIVDMKQLPTPDILFKAQGKGTDIYIRKTGISYVLSNMDEVMYQVSEQLEKLERAGRIDKQTEQKKKQELLGKKTIKLHRIDVDFEGGDPNVQVQAFDQVEGYNNYYYAHCPQGLTKINSYNQVILKNIYNNIDVKYYASTGLSTSSGKEHGLKYDIIVNPGADPSQIKLKYSGADGIEIKNGELRIKNSVGEMKEKLPKVYQNINGKIVDIKAEYILEHRSDNETIIHFKFSTFNSSFPLVVDPFVWATYYGGSGIEACTDIAVDAIGNAVITGYTYSLDFPVGGASVFQGSNSGGNGAALMDAYVVKFSPAGVRLWATYYGANGQDQGNGIATDPSGNIVITGYTYSTNFPVGASAGNNVFQPTYGNSGTASTYGDAFVVKFDPAGTRLWATYYGGAEMDSGLGISADAGGNLVITGSTLSINFPIGASGGNTIFQASFGGLSDAFVVKFAPNGTRLWATFYGGSGDENNGWRGGGIATDFNGDVVITGHTNSINFPTGLSAGNTMFQGAFGGGTGADAFVVKFASNGVRLWATYYGGNDVDEGLGITTDLSGNVIITGDTYSTNFPIGATFGNTVFQATSGGSYDAFVVKFDSRGMRLWATYHGGNQYEWALSCAADNNGNIYIIGDFEDNGYGNFPMNTCALQPVFGGGLEDWFVTKFKPTGERLCSTFLGGSVIEDDLDAGGGIATYQNYVYVAGGSNGGFPVTANAWQPTYGGGQGGNGEGDAVVAKFCGNSCGATNSISADFNFPGSICSNSAAQFTPAITSTLTCDINSYLYKWYFPGAQPSSSTQQTPGNITYSSVGTYTVSLVVDGPCGRDSVPKVITVTNCNCNMSVQTNIISNITCNGGANGSAKVTISSGAGGPYAYSWSNGSSSITNTLTSQISSLTSGTYTVTITEGVCRSVTSVTITQPVPLLAAISIPQWTCPPNTASITASGFNGVAPYIYNWSNGQSVQTATGLTPGNYTVTVKDQNGCTTSQTTGLNLPDAFAASTASTNISCNASGQATITITGGTPVFSYSWSNGLAGSLSAPGTITNSGLAAGGYTVTVIDGIGCASTRVFNITGTSPVSAIFTSSPACINTSVNFTNTGTPPGGSITYTWLISPLNPNVSGTTTDFSYTFSSAGTYSVTHTVSDGTCTNTVTQNITVANCNGPSVTATANSFCVGSCASVTASPLGGALPYIYSWSTGETTQNINPCPVSTTTYTVKVTDAGGFTATAVATATINPAISITATAILNCGVNSGSVTAMITGGSSNYTYSWSNGITTATSSLTSNISNLPANTYSVTVTDSKGCSTSSSAVIDPPFAAEYIKGTASCTGCGCKEWIMLAPSNGRAPYLYSWPGGYDKRYQNKLCPGNYIVKVTDKNGCSVNVVVNAP